VTHPALVMLPAGELFVTLSLLFFPGVTSLLLRSNELYLTTLCGKLTLRRFFCLKLGEIFPLISECSVSRWSQSVL